MESKLTNTFLSLFVEKNSDGTKTLRLKGKELEQRINMRLVRVDLEEIVEFMEANPEINEVNFSYNEIGDDGLETLAQTIFSDFNNIEHLNLIQCDITDQGMELFLNSIEPMYLKLKTLRLAANKLGPWGGYFTSLLVANCLDLEYLDVGDTDQTADSVDPFFVALWRSNIKVLNISRIIADHMFYQVDNTYLADSMSTFFYVLNPKHLIIACLFRFLQSNNTIVEFHAQKCGLEAHDVEHFIEGLKNNTSLQFLDIGYNNISCVGVEFLCEWLKTRPKLLAVNIAGNQIKNHGAEALSFAMPFTRIRLLDISYNKIEDKGMIAILNSLKKPYMLRYFYIWGNKFSHPTNKIIKRMLASTVLQQENIDVKIYCVDDVLHAARYPADKYKHRYYDVMDYGCRVELKIKKNRIEEEGEKPRALIKFKHIDRCPPLEDKTKLN